MTRAVSCAAAAWLALAVSARASFVGFFWIPGGESWAADVAGAPTPVGTNWVLDGTANGVASLMSTGGGNASLVTIGVSASAMADLRILNNTPEAYALSFSWATELDEAADSVSFLQGASETVIATGPGMHPGSMTIQLDPGQLFAWRVTSGPSNSVTASFGLLDPQVVVPEPSAGVLFAAGLVAAALRRRRR